MNQFRIGQGMDVHRFAEGRRLVLGGVEIPFEKGLEGHSDADVVLHAICDALLGATGRGDIGTYFPNTDARWKDVSSLELLDRVWGEIHEEGWRIGNLDVTILAERPKLAPHVPAMKEAIAGRLGIEPSQCAIKATTGERMGFVGREEGLFASCVALLERETAR